MKTQAGLHSRSNAKRFIALKISLSLKSLAIQYLSDFVPESLIRRASGVALMELPHAWSPKTWKPSDLLLAKSHLFEVTFCLAVVVLFKIPKKLVFSWKQHYKRWKAKPSCLHCSSISVRLKAVARPSCFSLQTNPFFFSTAKLVLWLILSWWILSQRVKSCKYWEWDKENGIYDGSVQCAITGPCCHCCLHSSKF